MLTLCTGLSSVAAVEVDQTVSISYEHPPGKLYSIGSHRLHLWCEGEGDPVALVDTGMGSTTLEWLPVMRKLARQTKVCAYDRGGYAWSEKGPQPRMSTRIARELDSLLRAAGVDGPFVLIGHSFGGFNMRQFARWREGDIAGMVLVDASHVDQFARFEALTGVSMTPSNRSFHLFQSPVPRKIAADLYPMARFFSQTRRMYETVKDEMYWFRASGKQVAMFKKPFPFPVTIISREQKVLSADSKTAQKEALWDELQSDLLRLSANSRRIVAQGSGHYIHLDRPDVVQDAVNEQIIKFRKRKFVAQAAAD